MTNTDREIVTIEYGVREAEGGGWIPVLWHNGKERWQWVFHGYDRDEALVMARHAACDEAAHYVGDWDVRVTARLSPDAATLLAMVSAAQGNLRLERKASRRKVGIQATDERMEAARELDAAGVCRMHVHNTWVAVVRV